jgi:hypothetical protein
MPTPTRPKILLHAGVLTPAGDGAYANELPECFVDFSDQSDIGLTWTLDLQGIVGSATTWTLGVKFQIGTLDTTDAGLSRFRWFDLQPEQAWEMISEGVGWYGGSHPAPSGGAEGTVATEASALPRTLKRTIRDYGALVRVVFVWSNVTGASADFGVTASLSTC